MKEKIKKNLIGFVIGVITTLSISVIAATYFPSNQTTYDNSVSGLQSTNVQDAIDELYGVCTYILTGGEAILDNTDIVTSGDGLYKDEYEEGKYTYKGANPNNYVTFNNEEAGWRIISISSDGTIKIMRAESIGDYQWDNYPYNNWNRPATLNTYLNEDYYNSLTSIAQSQIIEETYYAGAVTRDNNDMQDQISDEKSVTSKVKVALPMLSEYIRAHSNENCKTFGTYNDNHLTCRLTNWMFYNSIWWTLTPDDGYSNRLFYPINGQGGIGSWESTKSMSVRPVVTLSSEVQITSGTGLMSDSYILS